MSGLTVELSLPSSVEGGGLVVGEVTVRNAGPPATVSAWLGLAEGDLWLRVDDPAGRTRTVHGRYQLDVLPHEVTLADGEAIARGLQLASCDVPLFDQPGSYRLRSVYAPGVGMPEVESPVVTLTVHPAREPDDRAIAELVGTDGIGDALAMGHLDTGTPAAAALERLAADHADHAEAAVARLLLAGTAARDGAEPDWSAAFDGLRPDELARLVTALQPPATTADDPLTQAACRHLAAADASPAATRATAILLGRPFPAAAA
jgi:hypothetical protein